MNLLPLPCGHGLRKPESTWLPEKCDLCDPISWAFVGMWGRAWEPMLATYRRWGPEHVNRLLLSYREATGKEVPLEETS